MKKIIAMALAVLGTVVAGAASTACLLSVLDEPKMPASLLNK